MKQADPLSVENSVTKTKFWLCVVSLTLLSPAWALAQGRASALTQPLGSLNKAERALLAPLLERGPVTLVEFAKKGDLPGIVIASYVDAPADLTAAVIANPGAYPKFMRTLDSVEVLSKTANHISYKWSFQTGLLSLEGENSMTVLPPREGHPETGHRISVKSERGQLGEGRMVWRVFPLTAKRSLAVLSMRLDMRDANFIMQRLDAAAQSVNRSVNIALSHVMLLGTKREAERRAGHHWSPAAVVPFDAPSVDVKRMQTLLKRADLLSMEITADGIGKLSVVGRTGAELAQLSRVMREPEIFGKSLVPGSYARVKKRSDKSKTFEWGINLPLIGSSGTMKMTDYGSLLAIDAIDGAMKGGRWRFTTPTLPTGEAVVVGFSRFDITKSTWLIEKIASVDPMMGHGLAAATQVMMLRALRKRTRLEAEAAAKAGRTTKEVALTP